MLLAPAVGFAVDRLGLVPVAVAGLLVALPFTLRGFLRAEEKIREAAHQP